MITLKPEKVKNPINAKVGKVQTTYPGGAAKMTIFLSAGQSVYQADLTPALLRDLARLFETNVMAEWAGREVVIYAEGGDLRAGQP